MCGDGAACAETELIDRYPEVVDLLGRSTPAKDGDTCRRSRAAQALVGKAVALRGAPALTHRRGGTELPARTLERALRVLDGGRRTARVTLPPRSDS
ncbi:hypothetical protein ACIPMW_00475 [Streptomyces sp. NPDC086669]|uniref:hypothetical protein n=1 Tax=Streptomyces sp. NPDC086669 TaxID=3365753 RepID=UPI0037F1E24C